MMMMLRPFSLRLPVSALLGIFCFCLVISGALAETRTLTRDTKLHPRGWTVGELVEFKKNTSVTLNDVGEVVCGTLIKDTFLRPRGWERVINDYYYVTAYTDMGPYLYRRFFPITDRRYNIAIPGYGHLVYKGGTGVTFSEKGDVIRGTIADKATIRLGEGKYGFVMFADDTELSFFDSGAVMTGVLAEDTYLRPVGWAGFPRENDSAGFIKFSAKKPVSFNEQGDLTAGTLKEPAKLPAAGGTLKIFPAGSTVSFAESGVTLIK